MDIIQEISIEGAFVSPQTKEVEIPEGILVSATLDVGSLAYRHGIGTAAGLVNATLELVSLGRTIVIASAFLNKPSTSNQITMAVVTDLRTPIMVPAGSRVRLSYTSGVPGNFTSAPVKGSIVMRGV